MPTRTLLLAIVFVVGGTSSALASSNLDDTVVELTAMTITPFAVSATIIGVGNFLNLGSGGWRISGYIASASNFALGLSWTLAAAVVPDDEGALLAGGLIALATGALSLTATLISANSPPPQRDDVAVSVLTIAPSTIQAVDRSLAPALSILGTF